MSELKKNNKSSLRNRLIAFSSNFIAGILVLSFLGYQLDKYFETTNHVYLLTGVFLGFAWSIYETFKIVKLLNKDKDPDKSNFE